MTQFLLDIKEVFKKHGKPEPEDHSASQSHFLVLLLEAMEVLLTTVADVKSGLADQGTKISQLEADTNALIAKVGSGSGAPPPGGPTITQDDLDGIGTALTANNGRLDTLTAAVVAGTITPPPATAPSAPPSSVPSPTPDPTPAPVAAPAQPAAPGL